MPSVRRLVLTDLDRGTVHEFRDAEVRLGRDPACEISVADAPASAALSGVHARIVPRPTGWSLSDERSTTGTHVNHVRLVGSDQAILRTGDVVRLGAGAAARRFRVARIETLQRRATAPVRASDAADAARTTSDVRIAASAVGGAAAGTAALAARGGFNAPMIAGAAAVGATAGAAAIAVASAAESSAALRATSLFHAATRPASRGPTATAIWTGAVVGSVVTATAAGGFHALRGPAGDPRSPAPAVGRDAQAAADGSDTSEAARIRATAATVGQVIAGVTAWYGNTPVRIAGVVITRRGHVATGAVAVRREDGTRPDSVLVRWPDGPVRHAEPRATANGLGVLELRDWSGQWLADDARGAPMPRPSWTAVVGLDRDAPDPRLILSEAAAARTPDGGIEVRGASDRLLQGAALVDQDGRVIGVWLGGGRGVALERALTLVDTGPAGPPADAVRPPPRAPSSAAPPERPAT